MSDATLNTLLSRASRVVLADGRELDVAPLSIGIIGDFAAYFRVEPLRRFLADARALDLDAAFVRERLRELFERVERAGLADEEYLTLYADTGQGAAVLAWLATRSCGWSLDDVRRLAMDDIARIVNTMMGDVGRASAGESVSADDAAEQKKRLRARLEGVA